MTLYRFRVSLYVKNPEGWFFEWSIDTHHHVWATDVDSARIEANRLALKLQNMHNRKVEVACMFYDGQSMEIDADDISDIDNLSS